MSMGNMNHHSVIESGRENLAVPIGAEALSILNEIERFFSQRQVEAYLVGGFVRDS